MNELFSEKGPLERETIVEELSKNIDDYLSERDIVDGTIIVEELAEVFNSPKSTVRLALGRVPVNILTGGLIKKRN